MLPYHTTIKLNSLTVVHVASTKKYCKLDLHCKTGVQGRHGVQWHSVQCMAEANAVSTEFVFRQRGKRLLQPTASLIHGTLYNSYIGFHVWYWLLSLHYYGRRRSRNYRWSMPTIQQQRLWKARLARTKMQGPSQSQSGPPPTLTTVNLLGVILVQMTPSKFYSCRCCHITMNTMLLCYWFSGFKFLKCWKWCSLYTLAAYLLSGYLWVGVNYLGGEMRDGDLNFRPFALAADFLRRFRRRRFHITPYFQ